MLEVRRGGFHRIVLLTVALMLLVTLTSEADPEDEDCAECHGSFKRFETIPDGPSEVPVGEPFEVGIVILNHERRGIHYEIRGIQAEIHLPEDVGLGLVDGENATKTGGNVRRGETGSISWTIVANETGTMDIGFEMAGTAHFEHDSNQPDDALYRLEAALSLAVKDVGITLTDYSLTTFERETLTAEITMVSVYDITNVSITPSPSVAGSVEITSGEVDWSDGFRSIPANGTRSFTVSVSSDDPVDGSVLVSWDSEHGERRINVTISVLPMPVREGAGIDYLRIAGRISGMIEIPLAAFVIALGGFPPQVRPLLRRLGRARVTYHCYISYIILGIALFHLTVLLGGPFAGVLFSAGMVWGFLALAFLFALAINGALMRPFIKRLGRRYWLRIHQISSLGFVISMAVHAFMLGTEFAFLR